MFFNIASSSPLRSRTKLNCSQPVSNSIKPCSSVRLAKTCVTKKPVPKRPVVETDSYSLLDPPESNAAKSFEVNAMPSCSKTTFEGLQRKQILTEYSPFRGPGSR